MNKINKLFLFTVLFLLLTLSFSISKDVHAASILYKVKSGDTLYLIANKYGTTITDITQTNKLTSTMLYVGQTLTINTNPNYTVKSGDTLYLISLKYNTLVEDLINFNSLSTTNIYVGQVLRVIPPNPVMDLKSGTYVNAQTVSLQNTLTDVSTYFSLDGSIPTSQNSLYTSPISINKTGILKLIATKNGNYSDISEFNYTINYPPKPVMSSLENGIYIGGQDMNLTASEGDIYYTLDGSLPNYLSTKYTIPVKLLKSSIVKAVVYNSSTKLYSTVKEYNITINKPAPPTSNVPSGRYEDIINVSLSSPDSNEIIYTLDGSDPSTSGIWFAGSIKIDKPVTLKAGSIKNGVMSDVNTFSYDIDLKPKTPQASVNPGRYDTIQTIALSSQSPNTELFYTTDGSIPSSLSNKYINAITLNQPTTIKAIAVNKYGFSSDIASFTYEILIKPEKPDIETTAGVYYTPVNIKISSQTMESTIYYTLDGTNPTIYSTKYLSEFTLDRTSTVKAISVSKYGVVSDLAWSTFEIYLTPENPDFNIKAGTYYTVQNIELSTIAPLAEIYYTLDNSEPTGNSFKYTQPIRINKSTTIKAKSIRNGYNSQTVTLSLKVYLQQFVSHKVASGETLDTIAKKYYSSAAEIMSLNNLSTSSIYSGQILKVYSYKYTVLSGDTLALIAEKNNTTVDAIISVNKMASDIIFIGQFLKLPAWGVYSGLSANKGQTVAKLPTCSASKLPPPSVTSRPEYNVTFSTQKEEDLYWLSRIIYAEASGEIYLGQVAVGNVVINRSKNQYMRIKDIIFESVSGYIQFEPVINGTVFNNSNASCQSAALEAYNGSRPVGNSLFFLNPKIAQSNWITNNRTYYTTIGNHDFYL